MKNKSISKAIAMLLSCVLLLPSNAVYVYAEQGRNEMEVESETAEFIAGETQTISEEIHESESAAEESASETIEQTYGSESTAEELTSETIEETFESNGETEELTSETAEEIKSEVAEESESVMEEKTESDGTQENADADEQDLIVINGSILEDYNALLTQLKDDFTDSSFSEYGMNENNDASIFDKSTGVCTGSRRNYIKKYIIAKGIKSDDTYTVSAKMTNSDALFSMKYNSANDNVEFSLLMKTTSSSGIVSYFETSFYAKDNATNQMIFQTYVANSSPVMSYLAYANANAAEFDQDDVLDFTIYSAQPASMRPQYEKDLDKTASLGLQVLLLGMDSWLTQLYNSNITVGNFGFLTYKAAGTNHIWGDWVQEEGRKYRTCEICSEIEEITDLPEPDGDWELDAATGIQWKFSEGVLTVKYGGVLNYDTAPWEEVSETVTKLVLQEGVTGFNENVTVDLPNLTEVQIPASCTNIEDIWFAFDFNDKLEKIEVSSGNAKFSSVDGVLYNESGEKLLFYPHNKPDEVFILPDTCTEIDELYSYKVKELNLGTNLKTINNHIGGENVTLIKIPATLQHIIGSVFDVTEKLTNVIIDKNNPYLCYENYTLLSKNKKIIYQVMPCINSTTYKIPDTVEEIFSGVFYNDDKLQKLIIPKTVKKIGSGAFARMQKIEKIYLLSTSVQFTGKPFSIVGKDEAGTFYVPSEYAKSLVEGILKRDNIKNVKLIVDASADVPGDEQQEKEPNDSFETAMTLPMGKKVLATIGKEDENDYYIVFAEKEYAQTIYIENFDSFVGSVMIYNSAKRLEEMCTKSKFKYDVDSNSYYYTFTVHTTGDYYICVNASSLKEVPYGITHKNNSKDTSLDEEVAVESGKQYSRTVTANATAMNTLKNYIKQHGEYVDDTDLEEKQYIIRETGKTENEVVTLEYDIGYDGEEWIWFNVHKYDNGLNSASYPDEILFFGLSFEGKNEFRANTIHYTYGLDLYCNTDLRTVIDITNENYAELGCDFKFTSKNYSDIYDSEQLRRNATEMYNDALPRWEAFLERAEGKEGFKFSDLVVKNSSGELPPDDIEDSYSVYYDDQRTDISNCTIATIKPKAYDGKAYLPLPKVTMFVDGKNQKLVYGTDYRLLYTNNKNVGEGTVKVLGIGKYKGNNSKSFQITGKNMGKLTKVAGSVAVGDSSAEPIKIYDGTKLLIKGVDYDYTITESDVGKKGTAKIVVSALSESNYTGTAKVSVPVIETNGKILINSSDIALDTREYDYNGKPHTPGVTVTVNGTKLQKSDYSVAYKNNKECGTAYVVVKGKGKLYAGTAIAFFRIVTATGKTGFDSVVVNKGKNVVYNGKLQKPKVVVMMNGKKLSEKKDYTLDYTNHFNAGWGKVKITGIGNYEGLTQNTTFKIEQRMIKNTSIRAKSSTDYTLKYAGKVLIEGIDYEVEREEISGTDKVNLKFKGLKNFNGEVIKKKVKK